MIVFFKGIFPKAVVTSLLFGISVIYGAAKIKVDNSDVDLGTFREGETKVIRHVFKITNTGNEPLVLKKVKPG